MSCSYLELIRRLTPAEVYTAVYFSVWLGFLLAPRSVLLHAHGDKGSCGLINKHDSGCSATEHKGREEASSLCGALIVLRLLQCSQAYLW